MGETRPARGFSERAFSLLELAITLTVLAILTGTAVALMVRSTNRAESTVARANDRIAYTMHQVVWERITQNGGDRYRDPGPPVGMDAPADVNAEYMSRIEPMTSFWRVKRTGNHFGIAGVYRNGKLIAGTGTWAKPVTDWRLIYNMIGICFEHYWDPDKKSFEKNDSGKKEDRYRHLMIILVTSKGDTYWTTYECGSDIGSGTFKDPGWKDGRGSP